MGCSESKIENEGSVSRCKDRKQFMKSAVAWRNAFAAAHAGYAMALKNTGAALSDYAQGEGHDLRPSIPPSSAAPPPPPPDPQTSFPSSSSSSAGAPSTVQPPVDSLPPPPPPLPADLSPAAPLQRSASLPGLPVSQIRAKRPDQAAIVEEEADNIGSKPWEYLNPFNTDHIPAPSLSQPEEEQQQQQQQPQQQQQQQKSGRKARQNSGPLQHQRAGSASGGLEGKRMKPAAAVSQGVSFLQILTELDDYFLKSYESAHEVSKMLEAARLHYHSNFADNRGHIDHSDKILRVITWNSSIKGLRSGEWSKDDDLDDEKWETHATVLDKLLAWEKKLYDEVKAGELMKYEYQRKLHLLNKQKKAGVRAESLEKATAAVSQLHTRYNVDMQSMDSTILEINTLRDHKLYPRLVKLVDGMATMWESMHLHHSSQQKLVAGLRSGDISLIPRETTEQHHETTVQLWQIVREWHSQFQSLISHQKDYIRSLNGWLKLNLAPIDSADPKENDPQAQDKPPIWHLLRAWHDRFEKLPDLLAKSAIYSFSEVISTIAVLQEDELKLRDRCEETRKEFLRKKRGFEEWQRRRAEKRADKEAGDGEGGEAKDGLEQKKFAVESVEIRLLSEEETYKKTCKQVREKSVGSLRHKLPELFHALSEFALACSEMYAELRAISQAERPAADSA